MRPARTGDPTAPLLRRLSLLCGVLAWQQKLKNERAAAVKRVHAGIGAIPEEGACKAEASTSRCALGGRAGAGWWRVYAGG